jgi:penicillin-binding protein 1A
VDKGGANERSAPGREAQAGNEPTKAADRRARVVGGLKKWGKRSLAALLALAVVGLVAFWLTIRHYEEDLPDVHALKSSYHPPQVTRVLARDGTVLAELYTERRTVVPIESLPAHVKLAVLAAEDASFYEHEGLNYLGIVRAMLVNLKSGRFRQGGSTITQQVVKNVLLDPEKNFRRKMREALLARRLEQELSKDEILELYLNHIYFGQGRYGIEEAARGTFGKSAKDLSLAEAAMLAGTIANPEHYNPKRDMQKALSRRSYVLGQMHAKGFIGPELLEQAEAEPVHVSADADVDPGLAPEAVEIAKRLLYQVEPERGPRGGFTIHTTIDPKLQAAARKAVQAALAAYDKRHGLLGPLKAPPGPTVDKRGRAIKPPPPKDPPFEGTPVFEHHKVLIGVVTGADDARGTVSVRVGTVQGVFRLADYARYNPQKLAPSEFAPVGALVRVSLLAPPQAGPSAPGSPPAPVPLRMESGPEGALVAIDVRSRDVLALIGNYEALPGGLDRATQARRQPGSTFKPLVYSYALHARRFTPASLVDPTPTAFGNYRPSNYEGWKGLEPIRLREALANSVNVVAVRVLDDVGPQNVVSWAQSMGIASTLKPDLSLALGSYEVKPLELAGAYATFAAGGLFQEPRIVTRIVGPDGKDAELPARPPPRRVLDEAEAYVMTSMLSSVVDHGTAVRAKALGFPVVGKTGTSNQSKDTWFAGYSTEMAAVAWVGYDDGKPMPGETGASNALPAWMDVMKAAHEGKPKAEFPRPGGVVSVVIDKRTGKLPAEGTDPEQTMEEVFLAGTEPTEVGELPQPVAPQGTGAESGDAGVLPALPLE